jgi:hypothetical protein
VNGKNTRIFVIGALLLTIAFALIAYSFISVNTSVSINEGNGAHSNESPFYSGALGNSSAVASQIVNVPLTYYKPSNCGMTVSFQTKGSVSLSGQITQPSGQAISMGSSSFESGATLLHYEIAQTAIAGNYVVFIRVDNLSAIVDPSLTVLFSDCQSTTPTYPALNYTN